MKGYRNWAEKPFSRGDYVTLTVICLVIGAIAGVVEYLYMWEPSWWVKVKSAPEQIKSSVKDALGK